jgi:hypothetical protein
MKSLTFDLGLTESGKLEKSNASHVEVKRNVFIGIL